MRLYREKYADYGVTLAAECLASEDELSVPVSTLRRWLQRAGLWERRRSRKPHRRRRARREHCGELVQMDGSHHDWFEGRRGRAVLMVMIDDATGRVFARFFENESWHSAAAILRDYVQQQGLPRALYVDQHGIYRADRGGGQRPGGSRGKRTTDAVWPGVGGVGGRTDPGEEPAGEGPCGTDEWHLAGPLGKGFALGPRSATWSTPMRFSKRRFCPSSTPNLRSRRRSRRMCISRSRRIAISAASSRFSRSAWCRTIGRCVGRMDSCNWKSLANTQLRPRKRVIVCETIEGDLRLFAGDRELTWSPVRSRPQASRKKPKPRGDGIVRSSQGQRPSASHPWRKGLRGEGP